ncbi:DUF5615 family PIN-like protein [Sphingomonas montana]|uniref:DUF5615 family PIN-like protein n=1 Tax=Sphingomonas montana TaxID=1843236 RepID=UPI00096F13A3|nr:DUF5615 family PIN-like protein [Sphingomonas montana]
MRFLVDAQLPPGLCRWLAGRGHDAVHVSDVGLLAAADGVIADYAVAEDRIIVSKDEDFVILRLPDRFGFLWLRCGNASNVALRDWLAVRWDAIEPMLARGERFVEVV